MGSCRRCNHSSRDSSFHSHIYCLFASFLVFHKYSPLIIARVQYGSSGERIEWLNSLIARFLDILKSTHVPDDKLHLAAFVLFERIKLFALFSKHSGFSEEREWRIVYAPDRDSEQKLASMFHYSIRPRGAEPKLRLKIEPIHGLTTMDLSLEKIVEWIILGPNASSPMARRVVLRMLEQLNKASLKERIHVSSIPYRAVWCIGWLPTSPTRTCRRVAWIIGCLNDRFWLHHQPVNATHALNRSASVSYPNVLRGRSFNCRATLFNVACECTDNSVPFGKYCLRRRLVFSLEPRCQGLWGSQK